MRTVQSRVDGAKAECQQLLVHLERNDSNTGPAPGAAALGYPILEGPPGVELRPTAPPVPAERPSLPPNPPTGGVRSRGQGSANYLELRGLEEAANQSWRVRARPGGRKVAPPAGTGARCPRRGEQSPPRPSAGPEPPARHKARAPLTLLLLQGQLVLVVAVEVAPEEEGEFGVLLLLLHRHLLELGPVPRHELRQLVDDIPQLLVCGQGSAVSPRWPRRPAPTRRPPLRPRRRPGRAHRRAAAASPWLRDNGPPPLGRTGRKCREAPGGTRSRALRPRRRGDGAGHVRPFPAPPASGEVRAAASGHRDRPRPGPQAAPGAISARSSPSPSAAEGRGHVAFAGL